MFQRALNMLSHQRVRNLSIVTIYFLAYKVKFQIFFGWTFIPFYFIVDQEEDLSNKELLLEQRNDHKYRVCFRIISYS